MNITIGTILQDRTGYIRKYFKVLTLINDAIALKKLDGGTSPYLDELEWYDRKDIEVLVEAKEFKVITDFDRTVPLFVYGTLKKGYANEDYLDGAQFISKDAVQGQLWGGFSYPFLSPGDERVEGEVYEVPFYVQFKRIERMEVPCGYDLEEWITEKGKKVFVFVFNGDPKPRKLNKIKTF